VRIFISLFCLLIISIPEELFSQISENAVPYSFTYNLSPVTSFEEMPLFNKALLLKEDQAKADKGLKLQRFANMISIALHPYNSGTWEETGSGKVWRLGVYSSDAYSLYLIFQELKLAPGVKLFVYDAAVTRLEGAFTSANNNKFNKLSVVPIEGDRLIIELDVPSGTADFGKLLLGQVGHDYRGEFGTKKLKATSTDGSDCNIDINCPDGEPWQNEKRAVCKLIANGLLCTGTLITNEAEARIPYLITANHCMQNDSIAEEALFIFNYEEKNCGGKEVVSYHSLSGAELMATLVNLDFTLVRLLEYPPLYFMPYFAGWDARSNTPSSGVCLHHPGGDPTKISIENHPLETATYSDADFDPFSHWKVSHWEVGTTLGGSSGSGIFNSQHRLFGTLTGGEATCASPVNDFFAKFCLAWDKYPNAKNQLKYWLDSGNHGVSFMNGFDPYNVALGVCDTFWNIPKNEFITLYNSDLKWGNLSGHSSAGYTQFAEKFINQSTVKIPGVFLNMGKVSYANIASTMTVKIWEGDSYPTTELYQRSVNIKSLKERAVNFVGFDTLLTVGGNFFIGYEINYASHDTIAVYNASNRGPNGPSTMYVYKDGEWKSIDMVSNSALYTSLSIGLVGCDGSIEVPKAKGIKVFPNPCVGLAQVDLPEGVSITQVICYNIIGRPVPLQYQWSEGRLFIDSVDLLDGIYVLELRTRSKPLFGRFMVVKE
jgi:lysyl endopeptidase